MIYPISFAPLQGFTLAIYREAHAEVFGGVDTYYSPFVRWERGSVRNRDLHDIDPKYNILEHARFVPQILPGNVDEFRSLMMVIVRLGYHEVDMNWGCPFPLLTKRHKGAGLLAVPDEAKRILNALSDYPDIRFSIKMRLGMTSFDEGIALATSLNEAPLYQITVHPRVGIQQYKGEADWDAFARFVDRCRHPLVYNGDIQSVENIEQLTGRFPTIAGVMIGRGLLSRPSLAAEYKTGKRWSEQQLREGVRRMHDIIYSYESSVCQGEVQLLSKMQCFWEYLSPQIDKRIFKRLTKCTKLKNYLEAAKDI